MAERPRILRSLRVLDAVALALTAAALAAAPAHAAATVLAVGFADPSIDGATIALHRPGGAGELRNWRTLPGNHPAVGGGRLAYIERRDDRRRGRPRDRRARRRRARGLGDLGGVARATARCTPRR